MTRRSLAAAAIAAARRVRSVPRDAPARRRLRRHADRFRRWSARRSITPRDGYPLYFAIGARCFCADRRRTGARAESRVGGRRRGRLRAAVVLAGAELCGIDRRRHRRGAALRGSYTFWSQAVIAEVYALHIALVAATLLLAAALGSGSRRLRRLTLFFAVYALGFRQSPLDDPAAAGLCPFLPDRGAGRMALHVHAAHRRARASLCAAAGALQYAWNLRTLWLLPDRAARPRRALQRFWFDVTKSDWRETMVMNVPASMPRAAAMYAFDLAAAVRMDRSVAGRGRCCTGWRRTNGRVALLVGVAVHRERALRVQL